MKAYFLSITSFFLGLVCQIGNAQGPLLIKQTVDFEISGTGNNDAWKTAEWTILPQRNHPDDPRTTQVKILYSPKGIYFLFDCQDKYLTASMQNDFDHLWEEDVVEVFLWPDTLFTMYFEYEISPLNRELPILVPNINGKFLGWAPWDYEGDRKTVHKTSLRGQADGERKSIEGWIAEFFIPFELLRPLSKVPPRSGQLWRGNLYRLDYDQSDPAMRWTWSEVGPSFHDYKNFGYFLFE